MQAEMVLLTHFSQRYPKLPTLNAPNSAVIKVGDDGDDSSSVTSTGFSFETELTDDQKLAQAAAQLDSGGIPTCIAFDLMCIKFNQLHSLPLLLPAFRWLFPDEDEDEGNADEMVIVPHAHSHHHHDEDDDGGDGDSKHEQGDEAKVSQRAHSQSGGRTKRSASNTSTTSGKSGKKGGKRDAAAHSAAGGDQHVDSASMDGGAGARSKGSKSPFYNRQTFEKKQRI